MVGASGCGKSTFLRLLLGQEKADSRGTITLDGQPLAPEPDRSRGVVFQRYSVFPHLSVLDNVDRRSGAAVFAAALAVCSVPAASVTAREQAAADAGQSGARPRP